MDFVHSEDSISFEYPIIWRIPPPPGILLGVLWPDIRSHICTSVPSRSLRSNNDNSLSVPRVKTNTGARAFHSCLFGTTSRCLSVQPVQLQPSRNIWRHISLIWPFPHRYRHSPWPVDVTELFPRFCCWTLIWLSRHWAWLRRGYWRYGSLIDWLIDISWCGLWIFLGTLQSRQ